MSFWRCRTRSGDTCWSCSQRSTTAGELAGQFELSRPAVAEHLHVLRKAGLVRDEPSGRQRHYFLIAQPLAEVGEWLHPFERSWRERLGALATFAEESE